jgi:predicted methyltransferase
VLDHAANPGAPDRDRRPAPHRRRRQCARQSGRRSGFIYDGESKVLANPADDHTKPVFDPSIRGHTDQFVYKFRKPK